MMAVAVVALRAPQATALFLARLQQAQDERAEEPADEEYLHRAQFDAESFVHATALPRRALSATSLPLLYRIWVAGGFSRQL